MLHTCPYCGASVPSHGSCCRVPNDLDRFERVFQRLSDLEDNDFLRENLMRYLVAYGRHPDEDYTALIHPIRGSVNSATKGAW